MKPAFAQILSSLRREGGLSQKKAADDLGVSQALLSHYENGVREPKLEFILKVCNYYGVTTDYLLGRSQVKAAGREQPFCSVHAPLRRCFDAGSLLLALLSEIDDELLNEAVSNYFSYSLSFILTALRTPMRPYEPLFDAAVKTAEAELVKTAGLIKEKQAETNAGWTDETLREKYPDYYKTLLELDNLIEQAVCGIRELSKR